MRILARLIPILTVAALESSALGVGAGAAPLALPASHGAAVRDLGRAPAALPVTLALTLAYRHSAELQALVTLQGDERSPVYRRFLSNAQFANYFAPSVSDYVRTQAFLVRAGFRITHTFANRTLIDATAPVGIAERYFSTEIHRVSQAGVGIRYANARPALLPAELRTTVSAVSGLSNIAIAKPAFRFASPAQRAAMQLQARADSLAAERPQPGRNVGPRVRNTASRIDISRARTASRFRRDAVHTSATNVVADPSFESNSFTYWTQCGSVGATISSVRAHSGSYSERAGSTNSGSGEINGDAGLCQAVTVPTGGTLSFWVYQYSNEANTQYAYQDAYLMNSSGAIVDVLYKSVARNPSAAFVQKTFNLASYAGQTVYLYFGVHGDGYTGNSTFQYVDDVSLTGATTATPTPRPTATPTASAKPTATPTASAKPTATPTASAKPTATPTASAKPTATPTSAPPTATPKPSATPTAVATPTATPAASSAPIAGALHGPDGGYGPLAVAQGYDLPVQHGYNGKGHVTGVAISGDYSDTDLATYLQYFGVARTGPTTTRVAVDGGAPYSSAFVNSNASIEATLDVETIVGNAPGTALYMYLFPDLSSTSIEDGYNRAVSDGVVDVLNSSFGGCESDDTAFDNSVNAIATQAASKGITFAASTGDQGADSCGASYNVVGVSSPASAPEFVAVGGTNLQVGPTGTYGSESAWSGSGSAGGSGGGVSSQFAEPAYQSGVAGVTPSGRNLPDVAFAGDPAAGTSLYFGTGGSPGWVGPIGGTSWSSPIFSALLTEINQKQNARSGFVNPRIYAAYMKYGYVPYHDITTGNNGAYAAKAGYDNVTGIGSADGFVLSSDL